MSQVSSKNHHSHYKSTPVIHLRDLTLCGFSILLGAVVTGIAKVLISLIGFVTQLSFYGKLSTEFVSPADHHLGIWVIFLPAIGGLFVGLMARYGSKAIRGHGIPEAMEQVLFNQSKIPFRLTFLKPLSAAISIGTGGPFGAEGPIIATGGALGSFLGQILKISAAERKTLLAAGAAAGMTAVFGTPVSAVLLSIELLLFEFRPNSFIPVAMASLTAAILHFSWFGLNPTFNMPTLLHPTTQAQVFYGIEGLILGCISILITRFVYWIEDQFERLPIHWMYWPIIGGLIVGIIGYFEPQTLGVGYDRIEQILTGNWVGTPLILFAALKFLSWSFSLGSGTSGGTLAPLLMIGGALGASIGYFTSHLFPQIGIDIKMAALVGMAATFAGASRALLASIIFAFETTQQISSLLPLLTGCTTSFLFSTYLNRHSIMTEKIARRGYSVPHEYISDRFEHARVSEFASKKVVTFLEEDRILDIQAKFRSSNSTDYQYQSFPILNQSGDVIGILPREELLKSPLSHQTYLKDLALLSPVVIEQTSSLKQAIDLMNHEKTGRLVVVSHLGSFKLLGFLTLRDLLIPHHQSFQEKNQTERSFKLNLYKFKKGT